MKWRSRREVVDWLTSLSSKPCPTSSGDHITNITSPQKTWICLCCRGYSLGQTLFFGRFLPKEDDMDCFNVKPFPIHELLMGQISEFLVCQASNFTDVVLKVP